MEKSALTTEKINIELDDVRKNPEGGFINQKKKMEKAFPLKENNQTLTMPKK